MEMRYCVALMGRALLFAALIMPLHAFAQQVGVFEGQADIGTHVKPGSAVFIPESNQYVISGAGANIWGDHDEFHYVYKRMKGDFILYTRADFVGWNGVEQHRKVGWMIRKTLDGNSPHINAVVHGDGLTSLQFRRTPGAATEEIRSKLTHANIVQLERTGSTYTMRVARFGEPFAVEQQSIDLGDDVYVGLLVGSHNPDVTETGVFKDVRITVPYPGIANQRTQMTLGSNLEVLEIATGSREIVYSIPYSIQGPNWTRDGGHIVYNDNKGVMHTFDLAKKEPAVINTASVTNNNNDHVISFDGNNLGLSSSVRELGGSIIYTVPIGGGTPRQVTPRGPSYLHGWSPDGKSLVFCGDRGGEFDIYRVPADGGPEVRLTTSKGLDDGPEYAPDGRYIYFNSVRSGLMQIWRMRPDGSGQEQVTSDEFNNWFAHISPDGKWMVFLSFLKNEVEPGIHPPYKHVYIRLMAVPGEKGTKDPAKPRVLAYVYGGQGTINTPSWSPDSKRVAFVSNSDMK